MPSLKFLKTPGLSGSTIHDIFDITVSENTNMSGLTAAVCATTFSCNCELVPSTSVQVSDVDSSNGTQERLVSFENGLNATVYYGDLGYLSTIRLIPIPVRIFIPCHTDKP
jgi:hypothetical protein